MAYFNAIEGKVVDRGGKPFPSRIKVLMWRTGHRSATAKCRIPLRLANQNGPMERWRAHTGPDQNRMEVRHG